MLPRANRQAQTLRTTRVYADGQLKQSATGDHAWEWSLGDYTYDSLHEVTIELQYGGYAEWGKKLTVNRVHHLAGSVEVDYMSGHAPTRDDLDVLEAYYINMGYHRTEFHLDDEVPYVEMFNISGDGVWPSQQYWDYSNAYRDHSDDATWEWVLCLHYASWNGSAYGGLGGHWGDYGIFIIDQTLIWLAQWPWTPPISAYRRTALFHEYGHHLNIIDRDPSGNERYCANWHCAMATADLNIVNYPWYCEHHWSQRRWEGW